MPRTRESLTSQVQRFIPNFTFTSAPRAPHSFDDMFDGMDDDDDDDGMAAAAVRRQANFGDYRRATQGLRTSAPVVQEQRNLSVNRVRPGAVLLYHLERAPTGSDVWPDLRNREKVPAKYIALNPVAAPSGNRKNAWKVSRRIQGQRSPQLPSESRLPWVNEHGMGWPMSQEFSVPAEIFGQIILYLSRDDMKAMRLTCREFERKVAGHLFENVVVPFNTEIYGMLGAAKTQRNIDVKGKAKMTDPHTYQQGIGRLLWKNAKEDDTYEGHGLNVFKGFGPHIQRYGMSFEVEEGASSCLSYIPHELTLYRRIGVPTREENASHSHELLG